MSKTRGRDLIEEEREISLERVGCVCEACGTPSNLGEAVLSDGFTYCPKCAEKLGIKDDLPGEPDDVTFPGHYIRSEIQPLDFIRSVLTPDEFRGWIRGNVIRYVSRAGFKKGESLEKEFGKAIFYLRFFLGDDPREDRNVEEVPREILDDVETALAESLEQIRESKKLYLAVKWFLSHSGELEKANRREIAGLPSHVGAERIARERLEEAFSGSVKLRGEVEASEESEA